MANRAASGRLVALPEKWFCDHFDLPGLRVYQVLCISREDDTNQSARQTLFKNHLDVGQEKYHAYD